MTRHFFDEKHPLILFFLAFLIIGTNALAQPLVTSSFEEVSTGSSVDNDEWEQLGFNPDWSNGFENRGEIVTTEKRSGSKSLQVLYPKGKFGTNNSSGSGGQAKLQIPAKSEYYLSYWFKFDPNFSFGDEKKGGKLPGLATDPLCSGIETCNGNNGFTARFMWRENGRANLYLYHMDKPDAEGEYFQLSKSTGADLYWPRGEWIHIVERVKVNTGNNKNGIVQVWVDNEEVLFLDDIRFVNNGDKVDVLYFSTFHGGGNNDWAPTRDSYIWFDDIIVTENFSDIWDTDDDDNDGVPNAVDGCPTDPDKSSPGLCGCFTVEGQCQDCNGDANGTAFEDFCGNCVSGNTGLPECSGGNLYEDQFDDQVASLSGTNLVKVTTSETVCGEVQVEDASLGNFDPIYLEFPNPINMTANQRITARIRATEDVNVRFDLRDINGLSTNGSNGRVTKSVTGDPLLWTTIHYDYSDAAFTDNAMDKTQIESVAIMFDPGSAGFSGTVYFDYIAVGDETGEGNSTCIDGGGTADCNGDPNGTAYRDACDNCVGGNTGEIDCEAQNLYMDHLNNGDLSLSGTNLVKVAAEEFITNGFPCGQIKIEDVSLGNFDPIYLQFPSPIDFTANPKVVVRARSSEATVLRLDLRDVAGLSTNGSNGRVVKTLTADSTVWKEYTFEYPAAAFTDNAIDITQIERIAFMFDAGSPGFSGVVYLDYISAGDPVGVEGCIFVGLAEEDVKTTQVFPNPAQDVLHIQGEMLDRFRLIDASGMEVLSDSFESTSLGKVTLGNAPKGLYTLMLTLLDGTLEVHKLTVK